MQWIRVYDDDDDDIILCYVHIIMHVSFYMMHAGKCKIYKLCEETVELFTVVFFHAIFL